MAHKNVQLRTNPHEINGTEKAVNAPDFFEPLWKELHSLSGKKDTSLQALCFKIGLMINCIVITEEKMAKSRNGTLFVDKQKFINPRVREYYRDFIKIVAIFELWQKRKLPQRFDTLNKNENSWIKILCLLWYDLVSYTIY